MENTTPIWNSNTHKEWTSFILMPFILDAHLNDRETHSLWWNFKDASTDTRKKRTQWIP